MGLVARAIAGCGAVAVLALAVWFAACFEENLHCTQDTSLRIALFDMEPHVEEAIEGGPPLVYARGIGVALRAYFGSSIIAFLFLPGGSALAAAAGRMRFRRWGQITLVTAGVLLANSLLPNQIIGERLSALGWIALFLFALPLGVLAILLRAAFDLNAVRSTAPPRTPPPRR